MRESAIPCRVMTQSPLAVAGESSQALSTAPSRAVISTGRQCGAMPDGVAGGSFLGTCSEVSHSIMPPAVHTTTSAATETIARPIQILRFSSITYRYESAQSFVQRASAQALEERDHAFRQIPLHLPCEYVRVGLITPLFKSPRSGQITEPAVRVSEIESMSKWRIRAHAHGDLAEQLDWSRP